MTSTAGRAPGRACILFHLALQSVEIAANHPAGNPFSLIGLFLEHTFPLGGQFAAQLFVGSSAGYHGRHAGGLRSNSFDRFGPEFLCGSFRVLASHQRTRVRGGARQPGPRHGVQICEVQPKYAHDND